MELKLKLNDPIKAKEFFESKMAYTTGPAELKYFLEQGLKLNISDVREAEDYAEGHVPGQRFEACNGGSPFEFSMGISLFTNCESQEEIDRHTEALLRGGGEQLDCGWVKDRFGVYWQIAPAFMVDVMNGPDKERAARMSVALFQMKKIDIAKLKAAAGFALKNEENTAA